MVKDDENSSQLKKNKTELSTPITREALYELVWSEPMLKVAEKFGVSSSYMARVCTLLNVPRPERGYWARLAVGQVIKKPPLPTPRPGDELVWAREGEQVETKRPLPQPPSKTTPIPRKPAKDRPDQHPLIVGAKELFEAGRLSYRAEYLKPYKKNLVDLVVSKTGLSNALAFANEFFLALDSKGYNVVFAPHGENLRRAEVDQHEPPRKNRGNARYESDLWSPAHLTVVYLGTVAIGLTIIEISETIKVRYVNGKYIPEKDYVPPKRRGYVDHTWTTDRDFPSGRLRLQAYGPYWRTDWVKHWQEIKVGELSKQVKGIIGELEKAAEIVARQFEEGERKAEIERRELEIQREKWRREEEERRAAKNLKESREQLLQIIEAWGEVNRIEKFFQDVETRVAGFSNDQKQKVLERLKLARKMLGSIDALEHFFAWRSPDER